MCHSYAFARRLLRAASDPFEPTHVRYSSPQHLFHLRPWDLAVTDDNFVPGSILLDEFNEEQASAVHIAASVSLSKQFLITGIWSSPA